jgi:hypothetical protein
LRQNGFSQRLAVNVIGFSSPQIQS